MKWRTRSAKQLANGYFAIIGRVGDVLNVAGHRIGTWGVESALIDSGNVAEARREARRSCSDCCAILPPGVPVDTTTLADPTVVQQLKVHNDQYEAIGATD